MSTSRLAAAQLLFHSRNLPNVRLNRGCGSQSGLGAPANVAVCVVRLFPAAYGGKSRRRLSGLYGQGLPALMQFMNSSKFNS